MPAVATLTHIHKRSKLCEMHFQEERKGLLVCNRHSYGCRWRLEVIV